MPYNGKGYKKLTASKPKKVSKKAAKSRSMKGKGKK